MTTKVEVNSEIVLHWTEVIKNEVNGNFWLRLLGELLSSMFFVFSINLIIALGEDQIPVFKFFYNYNIGAGMWIGFMTVVSFVWFQRTTLSANLINLSLIYKRDQINSMEFWWSVLFQFIGGIAGALMVYLFAGTVLAGDGLHVMGGAYPKLKGLTNANVGLTGAPGNVDHTSILNPWMSIDFTKMDNKIYTYSYAAIQGMINATWIIVAFILNSIVDQKNNNRTKQLLLRYIILVVGISITTIFYANTSNWVRVLTPTIVNVIMQKEGSLLVLNTTLVYIAFQLIGVLVIYFELVWKDVIEPEEQKVHLKKEIKKEEGN